MAKRSAGSATRYLEQHGGSWRVSVNVPKVLQATLGATKIKRGLGTDSLSEANRLKWAVVAEIKNRMEEARRRLEKEKEGEGGVQGIDHDDLTTAALVSREDLQTLSDPSDHERQLEGLSEYADSLRGRPVGTGPDGQPVYDKEREARAGKFITIASGRETPVEVMLSEYHEQRDFLKRTEADNGRVLRYLVDWCGREGLRPTVERLGRREAGRFVRSMSTEQGLSSKTVNKYLSCLSSYWQWLEARGHGAQENVWRGQSLPAARRVEGQTERPFTDHEVATLLAGEPSATLGYLRPLMTIAALTGARIDAVVSLRVADALEVVKDKEGNAVRCLRFKPQKKERASRLVPIHSELLMIIDQLTEGKTPEQDLFTREDGSPRFPVDPEGNRERSMPAVKAFTRYRRAMGVDEVVPGKARSLVTFHSFRRWFATKAEEAGQPVHVIEAVTGHTRQGTMLDRYSGGPSIEQRKACVEAVRLSRIEV